MWTMLIYFRVTEHQSFDLSPVWGKSHKPHFLSGMERVVPARINYWEEAFNTEPLEAIQYESALLIPGPFPAFYILMEVLPAPGMKPNIFFLVQYRIMSVKRPICHGFI